MNPISDAISNINFFDGMDILRDSQFFDILFPFFLVYALLVTVLPRVKIFQNKSGEPMKSIIIVISFIVTFFGVSFKLPSGYSVGDLMMMLFPNISSLTIAILMLYIVGAILGVDVFKGLFKKDQSAYLFFIVAAIGLGSVFFYTGIVLGFWSYDPFSSLSLWNVTLALGLGILGVVFLLAGSFVLGFILLFVVITFILGDQEKSILLSFIDPVIFIIILFVVLVVVVGNPKDQKKELAKKLKDAEKTREEYTKQYAGKLPEKYESRVFDILDESYQNNKKEWEKNYGNEKY